MPELPSIPLDAEIELAKPSPALSTASTPYRLPTPPPETTLRRRRPASVAEPVVSSPTAIAYTARVSHALLWAVAFFASLIAVLVARGVVQNPPRALDLYASMALAGTIIFGASFVSVVVASSSQEEAP